MLPWPEFFPGAPAAIRITPITTSTPDEEPQSWYGKEQKSNEHSPASDRFAKAINPIVEYVRQGTPGGNSLLLTRTPLNFSAIGCNYLRS
jgi:hypothetical protein